MSNGKETGKVKWFDSVKGWGFLTTKAGVDVFVHYKSIEGAGFRNLREGDEVSFRVVEGPKGPQAYEVVPCGATEAERSTS